MQNEAKATKKGRQQQRKSRKRHFIDNDEQAQK